MGWVENLIQILWSEIKESEIIKESGVIVDELYDIEDSPEELFYTSENDINLGGLIRVANQEDSQFIDVDAEIIGKKNYTTRDDWTLTNGLKVRFRGDVQPEQYRDSLLCQTF